MELVPQTRNWEEFQRAARDYRTQIPVQIGVAETRMRVQLDGLDGKQREAKKDWIDKMLTWRRKWMELMAQYLEHMSQSNYELVVKYADAFADML